MQPIVTLTDRCRKCYSCVRSCPVKALKIEKTHPEIIFERCIGCGNCVETCPQHAKIVDDKISITEGFLASADPVIAVLGSSFPTFFHTISPGQLATGLRKAGFAEVHEGAYGSELIAPAYTKAIDSSSLPLISSHCPAVVDLIERHYPKLIDNLVPVVSPMVAIGRFIKSRNRKPVKVVYISSCIAAKFEIRSEGTLGAIDEVLTYQELEDMFKARSISLSALTETPFDGVQPQQGRLFPITTGSFRALSIATDPLDTDSVSISGEVNVMGIINDLAAERMTPRIADLRFCYHGCIGGPCENREITEFSKRKLIINHYRRNLPYRTADVYLGNHDRIDSSRTFQDKHVRLPAPRGGDIKTILQSTNKFTRKDELNCRACGYHTCREYAVAVFQGLANLEMCLPYNVQKLEEDRGVLIQKYELARRELDKEYGEDFIVGNDVRTDEVVELIKQVAPTPTTVLIRGESGTGKELAARAIHRHSLRNDKPLVTVNCTTLTDSLLESELFGHKKGSFTGAVSDKKGLFEAADGGTIFLDEIGDITPKLQAELLRVLDTGEVRPVGGTQSKKVDVRLIAATNKDLEAGIRDAWFREDLFYRLNVFTITMPPLRERMACLPLLVHHFVGIARKKLNKNIVGIEDRAIKAMMQYQWPGNIREMKNVLERAAVLAHEDVIKLGNLPLVFAENYAEGAADPPDLRSFKNEREPHVLRVEKKLIQRYLSDAGGNVSKAAQMANIPRRTFYRLLDKHGLKGLRSNPHEE